RCKSFAQRSVDHSMVVAGSAEPRVAVLKGVGSISVGKKHNFVYLPATGNCRELDGWIVLVVDGQAILASAGFGNCKRERFPLEGTRSGPRRHAGAQCVPNLLAPLLRRSFDTCGTTEIALGSFDDNLGEGLALRREVDVGLFRLGVLFDAVDGE